MQRWVDQWNAYWFPETTTLSLSVSRIVVVAAQLFWLSPRHDSLVYHFNVLEKNPEFIDPQLLIRVISAIVPDAVFFTPTAFTLLSWVTVIAGITALLGLFTRLSVFIFALGNWIFVAHRYSYADIHHTETIFCIFLMLLAFSPSGGRLSVDALMWRRQHRDGSGNTRAADRRETAIWPLKLAHVLLALTYFSTGLTKMVYGGLAWMNGYTLQSYLFDDAIHRAIPLGIWLAQQHTLCIFLSIFTVLFELFFFVSLIVRQTTPYFLVGGILFQLGLYVMARHDFFQHIILLTLLLVFLDHDRWVIWLDKGKQLFTLRSCQPA